MEEKKTFDEEISEIQEALSKLRDRHSSPDKDKTEFLIDVLESIEGEMLKSKPFPLGNMLVSEFKKAKNKILAEIFFKKAR